MGINERDTIDRGWYYVVEADDDLPEGVHPLTSGDGRTLTRRLHGFSGRVRVEDRCSPTLHPATLLRAAAAVGRGLEARGENDQRVDVVLTDESHEDGWSPEGCLRLHGPALATASSCHPIEARVALLLSEAPDRPTATPPDGPVSPRVLCFESLMNADMPHNDRELSQGVLHMVSPLADLDTEVVFANVKMAITGKERPVEGLSTLESVLQGDPFDLVCITLLEGYFEGVCELITTLRELGCRAHVAVGGVFPSLAPEHVMAHMPDVSFVCRGAGEHFLPSLVLALGPTDIDTPLDEDQLARLLNIDGVLARVSGPTGPVLLASRSDRTVAVESLDQVDLDLRHLEARHIEGGIEISTSRGCIHKCTFCSIMGRESFQARSAGGVFALLDRYQARYAELYGEDVPHNAYRVHVCDDDFACDRHRAKAFFEGLPQTRFRLSSAQVSIADLCRRENGVLLTEADTELLNVITPDCFADSERMIPESDFVEDHKSRDWSSFLQIGVETFSDRELIRLGKGYRVAHIRSIVDALAARGLHMDAYFIQSNADTTAADLIDGLDELCRIKMKYPRWFHLRFPIVPHLVSYFTSSSYRRIVRHGRTDALSIRHWARVDSHPEFDYPFVDHDIPQDPWVSSAVDSGFFTDRDLYTGSFVRLRQAWLDRLEDLPDGVDRRQGERLIRQLDDRPRRLAFERLAAARAVSHGQRMPEPSLPDVGEAMQSTERVVGPPARWLRAFQRYTSNTSPRLVVIPTWQCELRCRYCFIPKQDGRVMTDRTMEQSIDMLLASDRDAVILQFFGGEALMEWEKMQAALRYGTEQANALGKHLSFIISSNGWAIDEAKLEWLSQYPVRLELSLDGDSDTQNRFRRALERGQDSYEHGIPHKVDMIRAADLDYEVIMVVHPEAVHRLSENFFHIVDLGYERVQINFALGYIWTDEQKDAFAKGLHAIGAELRSRWGRGEDPTLVNLEGRPMPIRLNGEITVDWDGTVYGGNAFLHETPHKSKFAIGTLDDLGSFDRYWMDAPTNDHLLAWSYPPDVTRNNIQVGAIMTSFVRWMQALGLGPESIQPRWADNAEPQPLVTD